MRRAAAPAGPRGGPCDGAAQLPYVRAEHASLSGVWVCTLHSLTEWGVIEDAAIDRD